MAGCELIFVAGDATGTDQGGMDMNGRWKLVITVCCLVPAALPPWVWTAPAPYRATPEEVSGYVRQLGDDDKVVREAATKSLLRCGRNALPLLQKAVAGSDQEIAVQAQALIDIIDEDAIVLRRMKGTVRVDEERDGQPVTDVNLLYTGAGRDELKRLRNFPELARLKIGGMQITDEQIKQLKELKTLTEIMVVESSITDACVDDFAGLPRLTSLKLSNNKLGDKAAKKLTTFAKLKELRLASTQVSDEGLVDIGGMADLQEIDLSDTKVSDATVIRLIGLKKLTELHLNNTNMTDESIETLKQLKGLRSLSIQAKGVSQNGIEELRKALPKCKIGSK